MAILINGGTNDILIDGESVATDAEVTAQIGAIPIVDDATNSVKGIDYKGLLAEYIVSGSAVTSIDFSGLDINTHKSYRVEMELVNATASLATIYLFVNGDTTLTNYYRQLFDSDSTTSASGRANSAEIVGLRASNYLSSISFISKHTNGYAKITTLGNAINGSTVTKEDTCLVKTATVTNITQLTFTSSVASAIGVGSKIRIYRGDV